MTSKTATKPKAYQIPKYPRLMVSPARHKKLAAQAKKLGVSIAVVTEQQLKAYEKFQG